MIPLTTDIWISRSTALNDLIKSFKIEAIDFVIIYVFGMCMVILALAITIWIARNKKMADKFREMFKM